VAKASSALETPAPTIQIKRIGRHVAHITVVGTAPLIVHRFDEKAKQMMLDKMQGRKQPKAIRDPQADFERARHRLDDGRDGFPASGFKGAIVGGARHFQDKALSMVLLKQALFVTGEGPEMLVPIESPEPKMREDYVRIAMGTADLRYRPMFDPWRATLQIIFMPSLMSLDSVVALVDAGGLGGIGDGRPSAPKSMTGVWGTFQVDDSAEITEVIL
jgi:hypothetical protein